MVCQCCWLPSYKGRRRRVLEQVPELVLVIVVIVVANQEVQVLVPAPALERRKHDNKAWLLVCSCYLNNPKSRVLGVYSGTKHCSNTYL